MELVILFPSDKSSQTDENLLLKKDENGKYMKIENPDELSVSMNLLSLKEKSSENIFRGVIVNGKDFESLAYGAYKYITLLSGNMILKINNNAFVWFTAFMDFKYKNIWKLIENQKTYDQQMLLYQTDEPMAVSQELNIEETDPRKIIVHIFSIDKDKKSRFVRTYDLEALYIYAKSADTFFVLKEKNSLSPESNFDFAAKEILNMKKKFATLLIYTKSFDKTRDDSSLSSDDAMNHFAYIVAFSAQLIGSAADDKMRLLASIDDVNRNMSKHNLYIPAISICQGSGSGKTKLSCSLDSDLPCAYIVFREEGELSYPMKSRLGDLFLSCPLPLPEYSFKSQSLSKTNIGVYLRLIFAIVSDYLESILTLRENLKIRVGDKIFKGKSKFIRQKILQDCIEGKFFGTELKKFEDLSARNPHEILADADALPANIQNICEKISQNLNLPPGSAPLVITLDEVYLLSGDSKNVRVTSTNEELMDSSVERSNVVTRLRLLRRAMHALGVKSGIVFLTLGTKIDYADLNPKVGTDSMRNENRSELYPPFILSSNTDLFYTEIANLPISAEMLKDPRMILVRYAMGRPLWGSLAISEVVRMAEKKLANSSIESGEALIACWMLRTGIPASPHMIDISRHLVKSNMATLLNIHPNMPLMNVCYPSEPVLGMAAQELVDRHLIDYFANLRRHLMCKGFDRGDLAETLAAEICLQAVYKAEHVQPYLKNVCKDLDSLDFINSRKFVLENQVDAKILEDQVKKLNIETCSVASAALGYMKLTTVEGFLRALYGEHYNLLKLDQSISPRMLKGIIDFNHFIRLNDGFNLQDFFSNQEIEEIRKHKQHLPLINERKPSSSRKRFFCRAFNQLGLKRGAAFFMPEGYPGTDLMIPICLEDEPEPKVNPKDKKTKPPAPVPPHKKTTLAVLSIQVKAGALSSQDKLECAEKLFIDNKFVKCSERNNCQGCKYCFETMDNYSFMMQNQLALVFSFGPAKTDEKVEKLNLTGDGNKIPKSSELTVIFNNGPDYLKGLWGDKFDEVIEIVNDITSFYWLPHNFVDPKSGTGPYHRNQILEAYLDKPLFPELSTIFRKELGWDKVKNPNSDKKKYRELIEKMFINRTIKK